MSDSSFSDMYDNNDLSDIDLLLKAVEYDQSFQARSSRTRTSINRDRDLVEEHLLVDYFVANGDPPRYPDYYFRCRYRMSRKLFLEIVARVDNYIQTIHPLLEHFKFFVMRPDATDEYLQIGEHTAHDCPDHFTKCVIELFMPEFIKPDFNDTQKFYTAHNTVHGFPEMLGSIDCMHWEWINFPKA
ncbi:ALP1-like protein [Tanacetum coccineum]